MIDFSLLDDLPPAPVVLPGVDQPVARANALNLRQAHKMRKMLGKDAPIPSSLSPRPATTSARPLATSPRLPPRVKRVQAASPPPAHGSLSASPPPPLPPKPKVDIKKLRSPPPQRKEQQQPQPTAPVELITPEKDPFDEDNEDLVY